MRSVSLLFLFTISLYGAGELIGRHAPGFSLSDRSFRFHDPQDYYGKILIVEFMQTTCPHCAAFSRILEEAVAKYPGKLAVVSIVNPPDTPDKVNQYVASNKVTVPILFDCGQIALSYIRPKPGTQSGFDIPRVFVIDSTGVIRLDFEYGVLTKSIFEGRGLFAEIDKLLASPPAKR